MLSIEKINIDELEEDKKDKEVGSLRTVFLQVIF